jgi:4-hydroxybenzoate polyprenyltransferase
VFTAQLIMLELLVLRGINRECFADVAIIISLTFIYPFGKRFTHFVQAILGLNFAWTIILAAHMLDVDPWGEATKVPTLCFFAAIVTMPVFYDTIYASQDTADDIKSGVKGTAVLFRGYILSFLVTLTLTVAALLHTTASAIGMAMPYYSLSVYGPFATFVALIVATQKWNVMLAGSHLLYFTTYLSLLAGLCGNYLASH